MDRESAPLTVNRARSFSKNSLWLFWLAPAAFLGLFYLYPLASILQVSFERATGGILSPFQQVLSTPALLKVFGFTIWQALLSTFCTLVFGLPGAYLLARYKIWGKNFILAATGVSFVLPTLVVAAAFNALLGPRGWLNLLLKSAFGFDQPPIHFVNSFGAILAAHVFYNTTIVLRLVGDFWSHIDPRVTQAARVLGANNWQLFSRILLPLLRPAIAAAALLIFIFDFTSFGVILILGGPRFATLEVEIYNQAINLFNLPLAGALSVIQLIFTLGLTLAYNRINSNLTQPGNLRPQKVVQRSLRSWKSRLIAGMYLTILFALLTLPLIALVSRSFVSIEVTRSEPQRILLHPTLAYFRELGINRRESYFYSPPTTAIAISLAYAGATVLLAIGMGFPAAWYLTRQKNQRINRLLQSVVMLPLGTSAVTLGLGFIVALDSPPLDLRTSPLLIPLAHTLVAFPFVVRSLVPSLDSIKPRLRQAASMLGASPGDVLRRIELPLIGRALFVAAIFAFTISLGEFGATALVSRPEYPTIAVMIYRFISQPGALNLGQAMALSTILSFITGISMLAIEQFRIADIGEF